MPMIVRAVIVLAILALYGPAFAQNRFPGAGWTRIPPSESGWSAPALAKAQDWSKDIHSTAVMVVHHGAIVADWGDIEKRTELASVRKSFLSALIGIAVQENKIDLDNTLARLGIDDNAPSLTEVEKTATVRMLLQARSGIYHPALYETAAMAAKRPVRGSHLPGTFWYYNNWDFNALGTIYEKATGAGIYDALDRQIAKPIGMQDYRPADGTYFYGPDSTHRAYPIRMSARDLARFALLYLHNGNWAGHQIVPAAWVKESTTPYSAAGYGRGYAYLWWTGSGPEPAGDAEATFPADSFFALGAGGQYAIVIPSRDLVVINRVDRDQHLPEPRFKDVARLLRLILAAHG